MLCGVQGNSKFTSTNCKGVSENHGGFSVAGGIQGKDYFKGKTISRVRAGYNELTLEFSDGSVAKVFLDGNEDIQVRVSRSENIEFDLSYF